ncbi:MAG TPA: FliM/FliN family flagellar motor switch protein [Candidatus Eisenbacteria bacterium]|nr:FliM/FliN family flagellar motor switch protein [Candidatus Eisenbacteria bacterium]
MSRLLTPAEIEALRAAEPPAAAPGADAPFVAAPTETYRLTAEAGSAEIAPAALDQLEPGSVLPLSAAKPGLVEIVVNAVVVGYGRLEARDGEPCVRVVQLAPRPRPASRRGGNR